MLQESETETKCVKTKQVIYFGLEYLEAVGCKYVKEDKPSAFHTVILWI